MRKLSPLVILCMILSMVANAQINDNIYLDTKIEKNDYFYIPNDAVNRFVRKIELNNQGTLIVRFERPEDYNSAYTENIKDSIYKIINQLKETPIQGRYQKIIIAKTPSNNNTLIRQVHIPELYQEFYQNNNKIEPLKTENDTIIYILNRWIKQHGDSILSKVIYTFSIKDLNNFSPIDLAAIDAQQYHIEEKNSNIKYYLSRFATQYSIGIAASNQVPVLITSEANVMWKIGRVDNSNVQNFLGISFGGMQGYLQHYHSLSTISLIFGGYKVDRPNFRNPSFAFHLGYSKYITYTDINLPYIQNLDLINFALAFPISNSFYCKMSTNIKPKWQSDFALSSVGIYYKF